MNYKMKNKYSIFSIIKNSFSYHENWQRAWKDPEPKSSYDVVIVGGGGHGLSTAYYLAKEHNLKNNLNKCGTNTMYPSKKKFIFANLF
jgi:Tfp pilus assembly protein PilE